MGTGNRPQVRRIVISGYYGFNNSGDEAVLRSILLALEEQGREQGVEIQPVVLSGDPAWTSRMYGVESVRRMHPGDLWKALRGSDGLISGGGSLLQDATSAKTIPYYTGVMKLAQLLGKPTFAYSQGIGPVNRRWMDPLIRGVMKRSAYVSVRDAESAALLGRIGVPADRIEVVPDPVMGLPLPAGAASADPGALRAGEPPVVGVSLRRWRGDGADLGRAAEALVALSKRMPVRLRFLPFHTPSDTETSEQVMERLRGRLGDESSAELAAPGDDPQQMLLAVSRCDALFGMRLHALIYAANQYVPMLGLSYDPKIDQFLHRLGQAPIGTTDRLDAEAFADAACSLLADREGWLAVHKPAIDELKRQSQRPAQQIVQLLRHTLLR
ncbi:polysaccharide pyruvyl transferase CsaB [Paenibacillus arenilitoris]|uniref:Polysaccharide pyruvyl transferase CsaB n=1 Tax=Paenibacillus arenilitoris TaxID=2772299 RepID=A0A927CIZ6_9BACL|nr:polysaccharide pyruvyl transferase CsaB [Paenibacillus arenilitoris]MBD2868389.1 polysaccharide pyruvyl transferase CsaB [Paenibacillus arenilitoris]